ncbi:histidine kinase [Mediterraneibacter glycyrrhizinilyticus]|nr:sensor histidine kinase [Mediterraneibacter glycyrrhizinilyticus]MBM6801573.1 histidine kinase [Mediterraneibacter glycyrrhizinilyticus]
MKYTKQKTKNIQKILFSYFLISATALLVLFTIIFSGVQYYTLHRDMENDILRTCTSIANDIDLQISQMDNVCLNTINSTAIKDSFSDWASADLLSQSEQLQYQTTLSNSLTSVKGVDSSIRQVNIYSMNNKGFGTGNYTGALNLITSEQSWYEETKTQNGHRFFDVSQNFLFSRKTGTDSDRMYFSLYRMYFDIYHNPVGFVQVMKYYDTLFESAHFPQSDYDITVAVYDPDGRLIYPFIEDEDAEGHFDYYSAIKDQDSSNGAQVYNTVEKQQENVYSASLDYSDFTVVTSIRTTDFFLPIAHNLLWIPFLVIALFFGCLLSAKAISKWLASPLTRMYDFLSNIDPRDQFREIQMEDSDIIEIDKLRDSLNAALRSQKKSAQTMLLLKEQELQAQMLALQAQMNPHFLYNSLNTIGAMAEEGMCTEVAGMCQDITSILRYISSDKESVSSVEEELEHCDLYLKCMKQRYKTSLTYEFDIDDDLLDLPIPKLCVQLLIENSVKFATRTQPPWHIRIEGYIDEERWLICVKDNGTGFDEEVSKRLRSQMDEILAHSVLPSLELDGMGILNIFIRFYLTFGISFIFDFGNLPERGAFVIVGGHFNNEENKTL